MTREENLDFLTRIEKGPPVYFFNSTEEAVIKSLRNNQFMVKMKSGREFISEPTNKLSKLITDGIIEGQEISEKDYADFPFVKLL